MDIAIRKATRLEYRPPKRKHLETLIRWTVQNPDSIGEIVHLLEKRLRENSWIITFKVLIILHTLMREANGDNIYGYIERNNMAVLSTHGLKEKASAMNKIQNIHTYCSYLEKKTTSFRQLKKDYVKLTMKSRVGRLRHLAVNDGLLKETKVLQEQIESCLQCKFQWDAGDNAINFNAFRLVLEDLLALFRAVNEAVVNILDHYFAMEKTDARSALDIYKRFASQTEDTIAYLDRARKIQSDLSMEIPILKHAPLSLAAALEEYLDAPSAKEEEKRVPSPKQTSDQTALSPPPRSAAPVIDCLTSLDNEQTTLFMPNAPFMPSQLTGLPMQPQTIPVASLSSVTNNPFRASTAVLLSQNTGFQNLPIPGNGYLNQSFSTLPTMPTGQMNPSSNPFRSSTLPPQGLPNYSGLQAQMTGWQGAPSPSAGLVTQHVTGNPFTFTMASGPNTGYPVTSNPFSHEFQ